MIIVKTILRLLLVLLIVITSLCCSRVQDEGLFSEEITIKIQGQEYYSSEQWHSFDGIGHDYAIELSSYGMVYYLDTGIQLTIYWGYYHDIRDQYSEKSCGGLYYFIEDASFHNIFSLGENEFLYESLTSWDERSAGVKGVYVKLNIDGKRYYSYKIINGHYLNGSGNKYIELTEKKIIYESYNFITDPSECTDDKIRTLKLEGRFNCTVYSCDRNTEICDSIEITDCEFKGVLIE